MYDILVSFLGESKSSLDESYQLQFPCPRCIQEKGEDEAGKFNLEVSISKNVFNCWSCSAVDDAMKGSIFKLIRKYGNEALLRDYKEAIRDLRQNALYDLSLNNTEFSLLDEDDSMFNELSLPDGYKKLYGEDKMPEEPLRYLRERGISEDTIEKFRIGYIPISNGSKMMKQRIILPSYDTNGFLNYWTARDYVNEKWRPKYKNPDGVNRKDIIFNESNINWDIDVTLVEGPFDSIVYPNMIPLLGKKLGTDFRLYDVLMNNANANVNIFLDGDAYPAAKAVYKLLNRGTLLDRIRFIPIEKDEDPSSIFQKYGSEGIVSHIANAVKLNEIELMQ